MERNHRTNLCSVWILAIALSALASFTGCSGSKAFVKRGLKMEEVGMMQQAANFYLTAVSKDPYNTDGLAGLQRAGQWVLNDHLSRFDQELSLIHI